MGHQILAVGEVLWDLLPNGKQFGGTPTLPDALKYPWSAPSEARQ